MFGRSAEELEKMAKARRIVMWTRLDDGTRYVEYESARRELAD